MKTKKFLYIPSLFVILFALIFAQPAFAHGGDPRIEISTSQLNPGGTLDLRGVDFEFEEQITLVLASPQVEIPIGSVIADAEGIFQLSIALPTDLPEGTYTVRATTEDHVVESPQITVRGSADVQGMQADRLDEDAGYGLLAPMPTPLLGVSTAMPPAVPSKIIPSQPPPNRWGWIAAGIGLVVVLGLLFRAKR
jgi:hypothetical protein